MASVAALRLSHQVPASVEARDEYMRAWAGQYGPDVDLYLAVQPFAAGGFEGVIRFREDPGSVPRMPWDVGPFNDVPVTPRRRRAPEGARDENSLESSRRRTKRLIRWHCKNIGADHLITFTTRELSNTPGDLWVKWQRLVKAYRKATGEDLPYVAVPEPHPSNPDHWHLHIATHGHFKLNVARGLWWSICGGRGMGNVQVEYIKVRQGGWVAAKVASYISKYVTKALISSERFNKKRYSVAKSILAKRHHVKLEASTVGEAFSEACRRFGIRLPAFMALKGCLFVFPGNDGVWFQVPPSESCAYQVWDDPPF